MNRPPQDQVKPQNILIVEDDPQLAHAMEQELRRNYRTRTAATGKDALFLAETEPFDLILLDLNLPDMDGLDVAQQLQGSEAQILMVTARGDVQSRVDGLYAGASDYLSKPFDMAELVARIHARLRTARPERIFWGDLVLWPLSHECKVGDRSVDLTTQEFALLHLLLANQGRIYSKESLEDRLYDGEGPNSNAVEVLVSKTRRKLADAGASEVITTIRSMGYVVRRPPE